MALLIGDKAADFKAFTESLDLGQIGFLTQVLIFAAENDYSVVEEFYMHCANRWNALDGPERKKWAESGEERFFTYDARDRYAAEDEVTQKAAADLGLLDSGGSDGKPS